MEALLVLGLQSSRQTFTLSSEQAIVGAAAALLTFACVLFHYEVMSLASRYLPRVSMTRRSRVGVLILIMIAAHVVEVWMFALTYWYMDRWPELGQLVGEFDEGAFDFVYYSVTVFTTIGFGDIVPKGAIRILTGTEALVGLSLITWSASLAFLEMQGDWAEHRRRSKPE